MRSLKKLNLKNKVKSFFKIDIEKDLQEEERTKIFEKVTLFTLTKNKLFLGILFFLLIINTLVGFDINYFYIRAVLGFIFLITIPGLLIMLMMKIREVGFWEYLVYVVGLSVSFIMFGGLAVNWILPWLNITDKPLSLLPILICFNIFLIIFWIIAWIRNKDLKPLKIQYPKLDTINRIFFIIPILFPVLAILGAFLLNNHGTNILTMILIGGIAVYVLLITIFRKKLNENVFPWALLLIGFSLLLMFSMRSWYISGLDTNFEFSIFQMTKEKAFWSISNFRNAYNVMVSLTILPSILSFFCEINAQYIQKLFFSIIFNFLPLIIYIFSRKYFDKSTSFFIGLFFVFQSIFMKWYLIPSRQQMAFLFFGLIFLTFFTKDISSKTQRFFFMVWGFSMIVSHYSTTYIALAIFFLIYILIFLYRIYEKRRIKKGKIKSKQESEFCLTRILILLLLVFGFLWYSQISNVSSGPINFMKDSFSNLDRMFEEDVQMQGGSLLNQFNIFYKQTNPASLIKEYEESISSDLSNTPPNIEYKLSPKYSSGIVPTFNHSINFFILSFREFLKVLGKVFVILGILYLIIKRKKFDINFIAVNLACFSILVFLLILPFISIQYDISRTYQQVLIILSGMAIIGATISSKIIPKFNKEIVISIFLIFYFLALVGIFQQISGGGGITINLNNAGFEYTSLYVNGLEMKSSKWININSLNNKINIDASSFTKVILLSDLSIPNQIINDVHPRLIGKNNYIYSSHSNKIEGIGYKYFNGNLLSFNFPTEFLNDNKNKVYNNGGSEIFK